MSTPNSLVLPVADGTQMHAYVARPARAAAAPGLLLFQEAFGVNEHIRSVANRLAAAGYLVVAPELYHRTAAPGLEIPYNDFAAGKPHFERITVEGQAQDATAAYEWLQTQPGVQPDRVGAIGFCLGGRTAFIANAKLPLSCAVSYYGGGINSLPTLAPDLQAPHLFYWGGLDQHISPQDVRVVTDALDAAGKPYLNTLISYADHGFNCEARASYNQEAAAEAWALALAFFREKLGA